MSWEISEQRLLYIERPNSLQRNLQDFGDTDISMFRGKKREVNTSEGSFGPMTFATVCPGRENEL